MAHWLSMTTSLCNVVPFGLLLWLRASPTPEAIENESSRGNGGPGRPKPWELSLKPNPQRPKPLELLLKTNPQSSKTGELSLTPKPKSWKLSSKWKIPPELTP